MASSCGPGWTRSFATWTYRRGRCGCRTWLFLGYSMIAKISRVADGDQISIPKRDGAAEDVARAPILLVLYRRRWAVIVTTMLCVAMGMLYLLKATPIFTSSSRVYIEQFGRQILSDTPGSVSKSDSFLYTQAEIIRSAPILGAALDQVDWRRMKTFANVDNPVASLQLGGAFNVMVGRKDDIVTVSFDSPYPVEAAKVVNAIVAAYEERQSKYKKKSAEEVLTILQEQKEKYEAELEKHFQEMLSFKRDNGALSFQNDRGNIILERLATLLNTLTAADVEAVGLKAKRQATITMLADRDRVADFVNSLQLRSEGVDRDFDVLKSEIRRLKMNLKNAQQFSGDESNQVKILRENVAALEKEMGAKQLATAQAYLSQTIADQAAAEEKVRELTQQFEAQKKEALELNAKAAEFARLQANVDRTQKQCDLLDERIKQVSVNKEDVGSLNVQVLDVGRAADKPTKPNRTLTLAASMVLGLMLGGAFAFAREWVDQRLRTPEEVSAAIGIPVLGIVPHMDGKLPLPVRGLFVHLNSLSDIAEAYRTVRTALFFGTAPETKTLLVTSPAPGDGKSTTASNLAIAFAQAGHKTLLVDCDLRKPVQHKVHELEYEQGLSEVLAGGVKLREALRQTKIGRLYLLPCGGVPENPSEALTSKRFEQIIEALAAKFDKIVIDSPPVLPVADAQILSASVDATVLVVRMGKSTRKTAVAALDALRGVGGNVVGVAVNDMPRTRSGYGYYRGYGYYGDRSQSRRRELPIEAGGIALAGNERALMGDVVDEVAASTSRDVRS
jgi:succinoglycan biosynthesis transport protein ExoP